MPRLAGVLVSAGIPARPAALILAGGRASRMGGGDKPMIALGGRSILARIVERLTPQCADLLVSANGDPARFADLAVTVVPDHAEDQGGGPLAGILAGLDHLAGRGIGTALVVAGDMPFLPRDLAARLLDGLTPDAMVSGARYEGRRHPLASLWRVAASPALRRCLRDDKLRRVEAVTERLGVTWTDWSTGAVDPFTNINSPADRVAADEFVAALPSGTIP